MSAVHDFKTSLARSYAYANAPWWGEVYRAAFPDFATMANTRGGGWAQKGGVDRVITLNSGRTLYVDEKVREKSWGDFLLERWSDEARKAPGWIQQDLACDYIAYAFAPERTCYLLPFLQLRKAWLDHGRDWVARHREVRAENKGYTSVSVAVPKDELFSALNDAMAVSWKAAA